MSVYLDYPLADPRTISIQKYDSLGKIELHKHDFQEFVMITRGSCIHIYKNSEVVLMPGDVFLIPPHQFHGYDNNGDITIYNCQFYPDEIGGDCSDILRTVINRTDDQSGDSDTGEIHLDVLKNLPFNRPFESGKLRVPQKGNINKQGIIHLDPPTLDYVKEIFHKMIAEEQDRKIGFEYVRKAYLEIILVLIKRVQLKQYEGLREQYRPKEEMVYEAMEIIEKNLCEELDFSAFSRDRGISENYFRSVFKKVSGLSPKEYVNRLRISRALELFQLHDWSVAETAAAVGILDANYFSRLFKKIIGYPPRHFRKITDSSPGGENRF